MNLRTTMYSPPFCPRVVMFVVYERGVNLPPRHTLWVLRAQGEIIKVWKRTTEKSFVAELPFTSVLKPWEACVNWTPPPPCTAAPQHCVTRLAPALPNTSSRVFTLGSLCSSSSRRWMSDGRRWNIAPGLRADVTSWLQGAAENTRWHGYAANGKQ